jgi:transcriptional regulator with XRE-family HTH domain
MMQGSLPTRLRVLRAERGLTLREAAALTDVRPGTLSDLERGVRHPHDVTLSRIAKGYGVPVEELLEEPVPLTEAARESGPAPTDEESHDPRLSEVRRLNCLRMLASLAVRNAGRWEARLEESADENPLILVGWADEVLEAYIAFGQELRKHRVLVFDPLEHMSPREKGAQEWLFRTLGEMSRVADKVLERVGFELEHIRHGRVSVELKRDAQEMERRFRQIVEGYEATRVEMLQQA